MIGKVYCRVVETKIMFPSLDQLMKFSRKELRDYAKSIGVDQGQNKKDTALNLWQSGKATILAQLGN